MSKGFQRLLAVLGSIAALWAGVEVWGASRFRSFEPAWRAEVDAERQRMAGVCRPPLRGEARAANAAPEYEAVAARIAADAPSDPAKSELRKAAAAAPAPLAAAAAAYVDKHRAAVAAAREAARAERDDGGRPFDASFRKGDLALSLGV